jgi:hypothetical protein
MHVQQISNVFILFVSMMHGQTNIKRVYISCINDARSDKYHRCLYYLYQWCTVRQISNVSILFVSMVHGQTNINCVYIICINGARSDKYQIFIFLSNPTNSVVLTNYSIRKLLCNSKVAGKGNFLIYFLCFLRHFIYLIIASLNMVSFRASARCIHFMTVIRRVVLVKLEFSLNVFMFVAVCNIVVRT